MLLAVGVVKFYEPLTFIFAGLSPYKSPLVLSKPALT